MGEEGEKGGVFIFLGLPFVFRNRISFEFRNFKFLS